MIFGGGGLSGRAQGGSLVDEFDNLLQDPEEAGDAAHDVLQPGGVFGPGKVLCPPLDELKDNSDEHQQGQDKGPNGHSSHVVDKGHFERAPDWR